ncbi:MAG TPA: hypothetical protein VHN79_08940 [Lacunisphaera sp.]|nr:hypothetical protein [Lacunisphaera sp.]
MSARPGILSAKTRRRGSVVVFVLGIIMLAVFLITRLMDRAAVELAAESKATKRADLRQEAFSALEAALAVLADEAAAGDGLHDLSEGWDRPLRLMNYVPSEGYVAEVVVEDETGKLSLPQATEETLLAYLTAIGCPLTATDRVLDALLTWTRPDHISLERGSLEFDTAALPYDAPQRALRSFEELRAMPAVRDIFFDEQGRWNEIGNRFRAGASLFSFSATNFNSAAADSLLAHGLDRSRVSAIEQARKNRAAGMSSYYRSPAELAGAWGRDAPPPGLGTEALCLRVVVLVRFGGRDYRLDAWVGRPGSVSPGRTATGPTRDPGSAPAEPVIPSVRNNPRKRVDYPFQILELRENGS